MFLAFFAWEEAQRGIPQRTAGRVSFTHCQPLPGALPKGQESSTSRGSPPPRPGQNRLPVPRMHPRLGSQLWRAPSTRAKQEMLQSDHYQRPWSWSDHNTVPRRMFFRTLRLGQLNIGVEQLSHDREWGTNPFGRSPRERETLWNSPRTLLLLIFSIWKVLRCNKQLGNTLK